jgi:hypothetical protein
MRDGIALLGDELWPRLDDVKQLEQVLHTPIEVSEFGARPEGYDRSERCDGEAAKRRSNLLAPFASTDLTKARLLFTPLQIMRSRISHDTLTLSITSL